MVAAFRDAQHIRMSGFLLLPPSSILPPLPSRIPHLTVDQELLGRLRTALSERYTFERELGRGGMAVVFLAQDLKHGRPVAFKVLLPQVGDAIGAERFQREITIAAKLTHPHILALHDSGEASGLLYYVMPYMRGETLRTRMGRKKTLPVDEAVRIGIEVASALNHAHGEGVVHRDITTRVSPMVALSAD